MLDKPILGGWVICRPNPIVYTTNSIQGFTLMSDTHIGAAHVDYDLIKKELERAEDNDDRIAINGDVFDMILAKDHKRFVPGVLHPRLARRNDIVNAAIEWAVELFLPYAHLIDVIGIGNHETAQERFHNTDVVRILIYELQKQLKKEYKKHVIHYGGYGGFIDYRFRRKGENSRIAAGKRMIIHYYHGSGGSAPVTKGMIDFHRRSWVEADVIWLGHKHNRLSSGIQSLRCPVRGSDLEIRDVRQVMTGAYFQTYVSQSQASLKKHGRQSHWAADMGFAPQMMGGARLEVSVIGRDRQLEMKVIQ